MLPTTPHKSREIWFSVSYLQPIILFALAELSGPPILKRAGASVIKLEVSCVVSREKEGRINCLLFCWSLLLLLNIFILLRYYSQLNGFDRRLTSPACWSQIVADSLDFKGFTPKLIEGQKGTKCDGDRSFLTTEQVCCRASYWIGQIGPLPILLIFGEYTYQCKPPEPDLFMAPLKYKIYGRLAPGWQYAQANRLALMHWSLVLLCCYPSWWEERPPSKHKPAAWLRRKRGCSALLQS